jgi:hypothetical protein
MGNCAGIVTTLVTPEELPQLLRIAEELNIEIREVQPPPPDVPDLAEPDIDKQRKGLEDLFNLYN